LYFFFIFYFLSFFTSLFKMANAQEDCRNCEHWLYRAKLNTKDVAAATHLSLRGGMFSVRNQADSMQLYSMMARDIRGRVPFFLCEKRSDVFLFYLDLDYAAAAVIAQDTIFEIALRIQEAVRCCYRDYSPDEWLRRGLVSVLVCDEPTPVIVQKRSFVKTGVHIVFPNLFVTEEQANAIVSYTIQYMTSNCPQKPDALAWASVIDTAVYGNGKGLRMLGSSKCTRCPVCTRRVNIDANSDRRCAECHGLGYALCGKGRIYQPVWVIQGGDQSPAANTERFRNVNEYALVLSTILTAETRPCGAFALPENFVNLLPRNLKSMGRLHDREICSSDPRVVAIQEFVRSLRPEYSNIVIAKVIFNGGKSKTQKNSESYLCKTFGVGSHFCGNVQREHKSSTIYFLVSVKGVSQRCYSRKPPAIGTSGCTGYYSELRRITDPAMHMLLFPMVNAVGAELDKEFCTIFGPAWSADGDSNARVTILRRKRIIDRLGVAASIPPPMKKNRDNAAAAAAADDDFVVSSDEEL
jgi:hypothetical protein